MSAKKNWVNNPNAAEFYEEAEDRTHAMVEKIFTLLADDAAPMLLAIGACSRVAGALAAMCDEAPPRDRALDMMRQVSAHHYDLVKNRGRR